MGQTQRCADNTVQFSEGAKFYILLGTKVSVIVMTKHIFNSNCKTLFYILTHVINKQKLNKLIFDA